MYRRNEYSAERRPFIVIDTNRKNVSSVGRDTIQIDFTAAFMPYSLY